MVDCVSRPATNRADLALVLKKSLHILGVEPVVISNPCSPTDARRLRPRLVAGLSLGGQDTGSAFSVPGVKLGGPWTNLFTGFALPFAIFLEAYVALVGRGCIG